ncbi:hypothetical protein ABMS01_11560 [Lentilactobacillus parabuchneri]|uniref:hypothetical protein n=1 Tax=Lentilactobacillus parabuchneri TaxID=152331 RepID=UPI003862D38E
MFKWIKASSLLVVIAVMFIGWYVINPTNASANGVSTWIIGTWHNKHYTFKITHKKIFVKNRYTDKIRHYKIHSFVDTTDVGYISTAKGINHGFAVEGVNNKLHIFRYNNFPPSAKNWIWLKK